MKTIEVILVDENDEINSILQKGKFYLIEDQGCLLCSDIGKDGNCTFMNEGRLIWINKKNLHYRSYGQIGVCDSDHVKGGRVYNGWPYLFYKTHEENFFRVLKESGFK